MPAASSAATAPPLSCRFDILLLTGQGVGPGSPARILANAGLQLHAAADAAEARRILLQSPRVGIAVMDLHGASFYGTDLYAGLCQGLPHDRELAAIFLARSASVNDAVRALRLGAVDLLRSPVQPEHLLDAVARAGALLERRTTLRQSAADVDRLVAEMAASAAVLRRSAAQVAPLRAPAAGGTVEFSEPLDWLAHREDTSSLAFNQRQQRRVAAAIRAQAARRKVIGAGPVDDFTCWDMLLDLHAAALSGRTVSVTALCQATPAPPTTALRRLDEMVEAGLVVRVRDPSDRRRVLVHLSDVAAQRLRDHFEAAGASAGG